MRLETLVRRSTTLTLMSCAGLVAGNLAFVYLNLTHTSDLIAQTTNAAELRSALAHHWHHVWTYQVSALLVVEAFILGSILLFSSNFWGKKLLQPLKQLGTQLQTQNLQSVTATPGSLQEICDLAETLSALSKKIEQKAESDALVRIAAQVSHDVQSPLAALQMMTSDLSEVSDEKNAIIRAAIQRIQDISKDLLSKKRDSTKKATAWSLANVTESIVAEKLLQYQKRSEIQIQTQISPEINQVTAMLLSSDYQRVLSNLITNSIEAIEGPGQVTVTLDRSDDHVVVQVTDTGKGIPPSVFEKIGKPGVTFGKQEGSGLGLSHADSTIRSAGGTLQIASTLGAGTSVRIALPMAPSFQGA